MRKHLFVGVVTRSLPVIGIFLLFMAVTVAQAEPAILKSPDGRIAMTFQTFADDKPSPEGGKLAYDVSFNGKALFEPSGLSLDLLCQPPRATVRIKDARIDMTMQTLTDDRPNSEGGQLADSISFSGNLVLEPSGLIPNLQGQKPLGANVRIVNITMSNGHQAYHPLVGKTSSVALDFNALRLELEEIDVPKRKLTIEARAYNDAVAFRYIVPEQEALSEFVLTKEHTEFRPVKDAMTWSMVLPNYRSMYESEFLKLPISAFSNQGGVSSSVLIGLPLLMEVPGVAWVGIAEADLHDYAAMYLTNPSGSWLGHWLESLLAPQVENPAIAVKGNLPHQSAWRVLMIAADPGRLIESNVLTALNPESKIEDTSWIHAGKTAWDWWSGSIGADGKHAFTTENMKYYVDFAAKSGLEYMLIDAGWSVDGDITKMNGTVDIPDVVQHAKEKGVKIWIWLHYDETTRQLNEAFPLYEKWGVSGLKIDFVERDDQEGTEFYYRVAKKAAQHHLMVDFHGSTKPSGLERTWPNIVGYEAVLGMEQSKAGSRDNPDHHVTLPFTRMLVGPMDYTPGGFRNVTREDFEPRMIEPVVTGTRAHHLAMYVVYEAAVQMVADHPGAYEGEPSFQFIKDVPAAWDETKVINGVPGEYVTIARRRGNDWFLGSMTGWTPRQLEIPLTFLGEGSYTAEVYADAPDADRSPTHAAIEKKSVDRSTRLTMQLAPGGGCAVRFQPTR